MTRTPESSLRACEGPLSLTLRLCHWLEESHEIACGNQPQLLRAVASAHVQVARHNADLRIRVEQRPTVKRADLIATLEANPLQLADYGPLEDLARGLESNLDWALTRTLAAHPNAIALLDGGECVVDVILPFVARKEPRRADVLDWRVRGTGALELVLDRGDREMERSTLSRWIHPLSQALEGSGGEAARVCASMPQGLGPWELTWQGVLEHGGLTRSAGAPGLVESAIWQALLSLDQLACWFAVPDERTGPFLPTFRAVSGAIQHTLRTWLPGLLLRSDAACAETSFAYPLLAYSCSRIKAGGQKTELTHDVMQPAKLATTARSVWPHLSAEFARMESLLLRAGRADLASAYAPPAATRYWQYLRRDPRPLVASLANDGALYDLFVQWGDAARQVGLQRTKSAAKARQSLSHAWKTWVKAYYHRLRRLYPGRDVTALGDVLFVEATRALAQSMGVGDGTPAGLLLRNGERWRTLTGSPSREVEAA